MAAALIGKTPLYGYHLDQNRIPTIEVEVEAELKGSDYGAAGFLVGRRVKDGIPLLKLRNGPTHDELKSLGAAMAASGSVALYYVEGAILSPPVAPGHLEKISVDRKQIDEVYEKHPGEDADIIALGCPHCSRSELTRIADLLEGKIVRKDMWVCTARKIAEDCPDLVTRIEKSGAKVFCDTCMVVSPASEGFRKMMVNSGKALAYIPGLCGTRAGFGSTEECIEAATRGD